MNDDIEYDEDEHFISRTAQKKSMQVYIKIGEELLALSKSQLDAMPLHKELINALNVAKKIKVGNALKRQMSFIGKLIRNNNYEEIQQALEQLKQQDSLHERVSMLTEQWRDRLLNEPDALAAFISDYPQGDRQKLNQLLRHSLKEAKTNEANKDNPSASASSKYKKQLFKLLRETISV